MIIVLAGRRIDAPNAETIRFPLAMKNSVRQKILEFFRDKKATMPVSSAACGADLLAQDAARELGIQQHIILPFERERFRKTSVTDRPGDWGTLFDEICDEVEEKGKLFVLENFEEEEEAYSAVTTEIFKQAAHLQKTAKREKLLAVTVWEGKAKDETDETAAFVKKAKALNIKVEEILTK